MGSGLLEGPSEDVRIEGCGLDPDAMIEALRSEVGACGVRLGRLRCAETLCIKSSIAVRAGASESLSAVAKSLETLVVTSWIWDE